MTFLTWSGRARALPISDSLLSLIFIISVPVGDERELRADQHAARPRGGHRDLEQGQLAGLVVLRDLLHQS